MKRALYQKPSNNLKKILLFFVGTLLLPHFSVAQKTVPLADLSGQTILVTAPSNYGKRLARIIQKSGGKAVQIPCVETFINPNTTALNRFLAKANQYDWVVLPSRMAIDAFFKSYEKVKPISNLKFCAIGHDILYLKEKYNTVVAIHPKESGPNGIIAALKKIPNIKGQRIAVLAPQVKGVTEPDVTPNFIKALKKTGLKVKKIEAYITQIADPNRYTKELQLLKSGKIDLIAFTSSAEIEALIKLTSRQQIEQSVVACFGPYTGKNATKLGLHPEFIGKKYTSFDDFVLGISDYLKSSE
jgi:uroporphyrinogen-III synthase